MTSIAVFNDNWHVEDRSWLFGLAGPTDAISVTLDISAFNLALYTSGPDNYIPSGVVLGRITATGLYAPYNDVVATPANGLEVAACILFNTVKVPNLANLTIDCSSAGLIRGSVARLRLPVGHGLNAAAEVDLKHIDFADRY